MKFKSNVATKTNSGNINQDFALGQGMSERHLSQNYPMTPPSLEYILSSSEERALGNSQKAD